MKQLNIKIPFRLAALTLGLLLSVGAFAQSVVKGHVRDAKGEPVIGATIRVEGSQTGAVTDYDGNFQLQVKPGTLLTISYVGCQSQTVKAGPNISVTLTDDATVLDNVVVIGYGRAKKSDLTGSVTAIRPDDKNHGLEVNAQDMIQGKIAGVSVISNDGTPGGGAQIRVRGGSSLNASNDPLIVIDGLSMDTYGVKGLANPLSMVNPNDIETFTVLKDASATAIYGSRASNGVIIITTKKGRAGSAPKVSYNGNVSISTKRKTIDVLDGPAYTSFIKGLYGEDSEAYRALGYRDADGVQRFANTDWQDEIFRTAVSTDHNITVAGGLKNMPYRVSLGYTNNQGIVKTSKFERYTASINLAPSLLDDHLKFNINAKGMIAKSRYADGGAIGSAKQMDPTKPVTLSGEPYQSTYGGYFQWKSKSEFNDSDPRWAWTTNRNATQNPVALLEQKDDRATSKNAVGNIEVDYAIHGFEDLHLHANLGANFSSGKQDTDISPNSYSNTYYGYSGWSKEDSYNLSVNAYAQYVKDLCKAHHIDLMAGYEWQKFHQKSDYNGSGFYPATALGKDDKGNSLAGQKFNAPTTTTEYKTENYLVSFFGRLNYSLLDRYLLTFTLRGDGSSRFSKDNRWGVFPSVALAWKIKEESFLRDVSAVSDIKLRLGWGITGQQEGIGDYTYMPTYTPNLDHGYYAAIGDGAIVRPDAYNNDLTWEKTTTWNAGLDLAFLNNRLQFTLDWYYRKTKDLINDVYVSAGTNFKPQVKSNIGELHNTGFEFAVTARPIQTKDWNWEVNYNFTYNKNRIDELMSGKDESYYVATGGISAGTGGTIQAHSVGYAASSFYVYQQAYDSNGNLIPNTYVDRNGNGYIDAGDRYHYYKPAADVLMGFGSKLSYKQWDLGFTMRASLGNYVYNDSRAGMCNVGTGSVYTLNYLQNRPCDAVARNLQNPLTEQFYSDYWVENASFLKLDNITLGYSFEGLFKSGRWAGLSGRAYVTAQNVFTITNYEGLDPEVASGIDNNPYPRPFTTVIGLSLNF